MGFQYGDIEPESAIDKLSKLRKSRNYKAAHGRIHRNRKSSVYELVDYQQLTRWVLFQAINFRMDQYVYMPIIGNNSQSSA